MDYLHGHLAEAHYRQQQQAAAVALGEQLKRNLLLLLARP